MWRKLTECSHVWGWRLSTPVDRPPDKGVRRYGVATLDIIEFKRRLNIPGDAFIDKITETPRDVTVEWHRTAWR